MILTLECPRCRMIRIWNRTHEKGPGYCECGAWAPWRVHKPPPPGQRGYVRVLSDKGWQELHGPHWRENPNGWRQDTPPR